MPYRSHASRSYLILHIRQRLEALLGHNTLPVCTIEHVGGARYAVRFPSIGLHSNPSCVLYTQQVIDSFEPFLSLRIICATNVYDALELALRVIAEKGENRNDSGRCDVERKFVLEYRELLDEFWQALSEIRAVCV